MCLVEAKAKGQNTYMAAEEIEGGGGAFFIIFVYITIISYFILISNYYIQQLLAIISAVGLARPMSSDANMISLRAINFMSSPPSNIRANQ